jgi:flavin reductase (DIM6/NTAB) family NADH-FMN oxidoreductase RutF
MIIDLEKLNRKDRYKLMIGSILPRPIAWVSTMDEVGNLNLAPFSYFTAVCPEPMTLLFCPGVLPSGEKKNTWANIEKVPEFVINICNEDTAVAMNLSATVLPYGQSEFEWADVTPIASESIRVPRVAEAPISFECKLQQIVTVSDRPGGGAAIFGEVQIVHVRDDIYQGGYVHLEILRPIGRLAGAGYTKVSDTFEMKRVPPPQD